MSHHCPHCDSEISGESDWSKFLPATKFDLQQIEHQLNKIMSAITDFTAKVQAEFDKVNADLDAITVEITALNQKIIALQNSPGTLSAADQTALDAIQTSAASLQAKADALVPAVAPPAPTP
jgi:predicted  nucleic acid-binding Zn-ribbon protein